MNDRVTITRVPNIEDNNVASMKSTRNCASNPHTRERLQDWGVVIALLVVELCILLGGVVLEDLL